MALSVEIEKEIERIVSDLKPLESELDGKIRAFAKELPTAAAEWIDGEVQHRLRENSARVEKLGLEGVKRFKEKLTELKNNLPSLCERAIEEHSDWPHRLSKQQESASYQRGSESYFATVFRTAISHLGARLNWFGLLEESKGNYPSWRMLDSDRFRYSINPGFEESGLQTVVEYKRLLATHRELSKELQNKRKELSKAKAQELWNAA